MTMLSRRRIGWGALVALLVGLLAWQLASAAGGTPDPTNPATHLSHFAVVLDSGILVLREGLETILVLTVFTASMRGTGIVYRRPRGRHDPDKGRAPRARPKRRQALRRTAAPRPSH
jgi:hypothetical protein